MSTPGAISPHEAHRLAVDRFIHGHASVAEQICLAVLSASPDYYPSVELLAMIQEQQGRNAEALASYEKAARISPGHGLPFTRMSILRIRPILGLPPRARPRSAVRRISMSSLGMNGRIGNQLLQYAFLRFYAAEHDLVPEVPDWVGRDLFDFDDPLPGEPLPLLSEDQVDLFAALNDKNSIPYVNVDLNGYFCTPTSSWTRHQSQFRQLFQPGRKLRPYLDEAVWKLKSCGNTVVAVHVRRGDFGYGPFWVAPTCWYGAWLKELWPRLDRPVLYVASDDPTCIEHLNCFSPIGLAELGVSLPGAEFYIDHYLLSQADHLAISNSTFSFTAAMLNDRAQTFVRPDPTGHCLVPFDPWNAVVTLSPPAATYELAAADQLLIRQLIKPTDVVLHIGEFCSPWTTLLRSVYPQLKVYEVEPHVTLNSFRKNAGIPHVDFIRIGVGVPIDAIVTSAAEELSYGEIKFIQFAAADQRSISKAILQLTESGYTIHRIGVRGIEPIANPLKKIVTGSSYLAICPFESNATRNLVV